MVQIGPIKYDKEEEAILTRSLLLGILFGLPLGILLNYVLGFPTVPKQIPSDFLYLLSSLFAMLMSFLGFGWIVMIVLSVCFLKKKQQILSRQNIGRILFATIIAFPVLLFYAALIFSAVHVPFNTFFAWLGFTTLYWIGALLLFPFIILFIAIVGPDSKPGKILHRFIRRLERSVKENED